MRWNTFGKIRYDPSLLENISSHLSRKKPLHSIQERMLLQDNDSSGGSKLKKHNRSKKRKSKKKEN